MYIVYYHDGNIRYGGIIVMVSLPLSPLKERPLKKSKNKKKQNDGVAMLAALLTVPDCEVRSAAMGALMMITTVDAGG